VYVLHNELSSVPYKALWFGNASFLRCRIVGVATTCVGRSQRLIPFPVDTIKLDPSSSIQYIQNDDTIAPENFVDLLMSALPWYSYALRMGVDDQSSDLEA